MKESLHTGEWFLPDGNSKLPGRLIFDNKKKKISLELFGDRYIDGEPMIKNIDNRDKKYNSKNFNDSFKEYHSLIIGEAHGHITLYNCQWDGTKELGNDIYLIKYIAEFAFFGVHVNSIDQSIIKSATFIFPYLSSWYDGWESVNKLSVFEDREFSLSDRINNERVASTVTIKTGVNLIFYDEYSKLLREVGVHHEVKYQKFIKFQYDISVSFKEMINDVFVFASLLKFSLGKPLKKMLTEIEINKENVITYDSNFHKENFIRIPVGNFSLHKGEDVIRHSMHQNYMLISRWKMEIEDLQSVIKKWYSNELFFSIYDLYIDSNNWLQNTTAMLSNIMFNNKFLNIVQGLEAYYRKGLKQTIPNRTQIEQERKEFEKKKMKILLSIKKDDKELKQWLNSNFNYKSKERLQPKLESILTVLIESLNDILIPIFGKNEIIDFFPKFSSKIRDDLSHGLNEKTSQGNVLHLFFQTGQILLTICILKSLDVKDIGEKIKGYNTFSRYIDEIKRSKLVFV